MTRSCPNCSSLISASAATCDYCGEDVATSLNKRESELSTETPDPDTKTCPECAEEIKYAAKVCRYCGHRFASSESKPSLNRASPGDGLMRAGQALTNTGKTINSIVWSIIMIVVIVFLFKACGSADDPGSSDTLRRGNTGSTRWLNGWTCNGLRETFILGDPAEDPLHDWTQADVAAARTEYEDRC